MTPLPYLNLTNCIRSLSIGLFLWGGFDAHVRVVLLLDTDYLAWHCDLWTLGGCTCLSLQVLDRGKLDRVGTRSLGPSLGVGSPHVG
jgi:hypothetical protein